MTIFFTVLGLATGVLMGLLGVGGGVLLIPALMLGAGFEQTKATGTTLAVLLPPVGLAAAYEYYRHDHVDIRAAVILAVGIFIGAWLGALAAQRIPKGWLEIGFAVFILGMGVWMIRDSWRKLG